MRGAAVFSGCAIVRRIIVGRIEKHRIKHAEIARRERVAFNDLNVVANTISRDILARQRCVSWIAFDAHAAQLRRGLRNCDDGCANTTTKLNHAPVIDAAHRRREQNRIQIDPVSAFRLPQDNPSVQDRVFGEFVVTQAVRPLRAVVEFALTGA